MFITALFIIAKMWRHHKCPSAGERINTQCALTGILFGNE